MPESSAKAIYTTPQQAEAAFYEAIERADLDAMMAVWAEDEEIICIHPGGPRLDGYAAVREAGASSCVYRRTVRRPCRWM